MNPLNNFFKSKWRRKKHKGVSGNFSTLVILSLVMAGAYTFSGGGLPEPVPTYENGFVEADPLPDQPKHGKTGAITFHELRFKRRPVIPPAETTTCSQSSIAFLVDVSGSMLKTTTDGRRKIDVLRNAIVRFTQALPDEALVGIYSFSEPFDGVIGKSPGEQGMTEPSIPEPRERMAIAPLSESQTNLQGVLDGLVPYDFAATYMRDGLEQADIWLRASKVKYPVHDQTLIFISDGIPEPDGVEETLEGEPIDSIYEKISEGRYFNPLQDPTKEPNVGSRIKANGVRIYSLAVYSQDDAIILPRLRSILTNIASQPSEQHYIDSLNADDIESKLIQIKNQICPQT